MSKFLCRARLAGSCVWSLVHKFCNSSLCEHRLENRTTPFSSKLTTVTKDCNTCDHWRIQGGGQGRPPGGSNSFIFMQFSTKNWKIIALLGVGAPSSGKSWIRHWWRLFSVANNVDLHFNFFQYLNYNERRQKWKWPDLVRILHSVSRWGRADTLRAQSHACHRRCSRNRIHLRRCHSHPVIPTNSTRI